MKVVVTRAPEQAGELIGRLEQLGHEVVLCPLVRVEPLGDAPVDLTGYDWLVVTSANGADELARRWTGALPRVAAIGPGTARALRAHGLPVDFVPSVSTQEGLADELPQPSGRILFAGAKDARPHLARALGADVVPLYRTVALAPDLPADADLVVLASASAARALGALRGDVPIVSIGPQTTAAARASGLRVAAEAETHDVDGLLAAVAKAAAAGTARA